MYDFSLTTMTRSPCTPARNGAADLAVAWWKASLHLSFRLVRKLLAIAVPWAAVALALTEIHAITAPSSHWLAAAEPWFTAVSAGAITMLLPST